MVQKTSPVVHAKKAPSSTASTTLTHSDNSINYLDETTATSMSAWNTPTNPWATLDSAKQALGTTNVSQMLPPLVAEPVKAILPAACAEKSKASGPEKATEKRQSGKEKVKDEIPTADTTDGFTLVINKKRKSKGA